MHELRLSHAALPAPVRILGLPLRPYSLGHELFLWREQSPFLTDPSAAKLADIVKAAWICSSSWRENCSAHGSILALIKAGIWKLRIRRPNVDLERQAFVDYLESGSLEFRLSDIPREGSSPRIPGCPFILRLHRFMWHEPGMTEESAWDYPYGMAKMDWACHWEQEGGLDIYSEQEAIHDAAQAKMDAEEAAQAKEGTCPG